MSLLWLDRVWCLFRAPLIIIKARVELVARLVTKDTAVGDYSCRDLYHYNIIVWAWGEGGDIVLPGNTAWLTGRQEVVLLNCELVLLRELLSIIKW